MRVKVRFVNGGVVETFYIVICAVLCCAIYRLEGGEYLKHGLLLFVIFIVISLISFSNYILA